MWFRDRKDDPRISNRTLEWTQTLVETLAVGISSDHNKIVKGPYLVGEILKIEPVFLYNPAIPSFCAAPVESHLHLSLFSNPTDQCTHDFLVSVVLDEQCDLMH